jgi:hypothetical protein
MAGALGCLGVFFELANSLDDIIMALGFIKWESLQLQSRS